MIFNVKYGVTVLGTKLHSCHIKKYKQKDGISKMHVNYVHFIEQLRRLESPMCTVSIKGQCHEICI